MSQDKTIFFYGIEAVIPPSPLQQYLNLYLQGCPGPDGKQSDRSFVLNCLESQAVELFAASAAMRWHGIYTALEMPGASAPVCGSPRNQDLYDKAREQFGEWNEIRIRAIKHQQAKIEKESQPCRTSGTTPAASLSNAPSRSSKSGSSKRARRTS